MTGKNQIFFLESYGECQGKQEFKRSGQLFLLINLWIMCIVNNIPYEDQLSSPINLQQICPIIIMKPFQYFRDLQLTFQDYCPWIKCIKRLIKHVFPTIRQTIDVDSSGSNVCTNHIADFIILKEIRKQWQLAPSSSMLLRIC